MLQEAKSSPQTIQAVREDFYKLMLEQYFAVDWLSFAITRKPLKTTLQRPEKVRSSSSPSPVAIQEDLNSLETNTSSTTLATLQGLSSESISKMAAFLGLTQKSPTVYSFQGDMYGDRYVANLSHAPWVLPRDWMTAKHQKQFDSISVRS